MNGDLLRRHAGRRIAPVAVSCAAANGAGLHGINITGRQVGCYDAARTGGFHRRQRHTLRRDDLHLIRRRVVHALQINHQLTARLIINVQDDGRLQRALCAVRAGGFEP